MNKLIGEAEEEDDLFWGTSHGTWDDDEDDERVEYHDSGFSFFLHAPVERIRSMLTACLLRGRGLRRLRHRQELGGRREY